ncbi:unnamed protein product [Rotaria sp. Silwood2]|nr:unnamed protein product [Rotaria sp. Silwood2]CAF4618787.1 unnamed protein product [Rotaria sp. Silwood2]
MNTSTNDTVFLPLMENGRWLKLVIFPLVQVPSCLCAIFLIYYLIFNPRLRQSLSNHTILLLLVISLFFNTNVLGILEDYWRRSYTWPPSDLFCSYANISFYSTSASNLLIMAFASIERHILIFHINLTNSPVKRLCSHYAPMILIPLYALFFYIGAIAIYPCESIYDYSQRFCLWPCFYMDKILPAIEAIVNVGLPFVIIPIASISLFIRVLWQKRSMQLQAYKWKRDRKMTLQLLSITLLYLILWMPLNMALVINVFWLPDFLIEEQVNYIYLMPFIVQLLYPFIALLSYPELWRKNRRILLNTVTAYHTVQHNFIRLSRIRNNN